MRLWRTIALGVAAGLAVTGVVRDGTVRGPTLSHCYGGVDASVCLGCQRRFALVDLTWGPRSFRMTARGFSVPGLTVGAISNSAGVCDEGEAARYGAEHAGGSGPDDGPNPPQTGFAWAF